MYGKKLDKLIDEIRLLREEISKSRVVTLQEAPETYWQNMRRIIGSYLESIDSKVATEPTVSAVKSTIGGIIKISFPPDALLSDLNITSNTTLTDRIIQCKNLYVAAGVTLTVPSGALIMVKYTAQIDGYLVPAPSASGGSGSASSYGSGAGGAGGASGGIVVVVAGTEIKGSGKIQSNGSNGGNGGNGGSGTGNGIFSGSAGGAGTSTSYLGGSNPSSPSGGGGGTGNAAGGAGGSGGARLNEVLLPILDVLWYGPLTDYPISMAIVGSGGGGGSGGSVNSSSAYSAGGGGGGAGGSCVTNGGNGGAGGAASAAATNETGGGGGGGGGAGGIVVLVSPSISIAGIEAKGGNGGNGGSGYNSGGNGGGGGGGSGGFVMVFVDTWSSSVDVSGGAGGTGANNGANGANGVVLKLPFSSFFSIG